MKKLLFFLIFCIAFYLSAQQNTRFMVVGDSHISSPSSNFKKTMLYELVLAAINEQVDFIFFSGDLAIGSFSEPSEEDLVLRDWRFVLDTLYQHKIQVYACRGNNDISSKASWDSLFKGKYSFPQNGPDNEINITYALTHNNILFLVLDQYTNYHRINQRWLDDILQQFNYPHIFVAGHEPAFKLLHTSCLGACPAARDSLWESLLAAQAKIYFCGHDHFYDHAVIDDGDGNPNNDLHQVIVGTGSYCHSDAEYDGDNGRWTPLRLFHEENNGYVLVEVLDNEVLMTWKQRTGEGIYEEGGDAYLFAATSIERNEITANHFELFQNYPNPFNSVTRIEYQVPVRRPDGASISEAELSIYNTLGQKMVTFVCETQPVDTYCLEWDASGYASGIYFYTLLSENGFKETKKMILIR